MSQQASSPAAEAWLAPRKHDVSVIRDRLQPSSAWPALILRSPSCESVGWGAIRLYEDTEFGPDPSPC